MNGWRRLKQRSLNWKRALSAETDSVLSGLQNFNRCAGNWLGLRRWRAMKLTTCVLACCALVLSQGCKSSPKRVRTVYVIPPAEWMQAQAVTMPPDGAIDCQVLYDYTLTVQEGWDARNIDMDKLHQYVLERSRRGEVD